MQTYVKATMWQTIQRYIAEQNVNVSQQAIDFSIDCVKQIHDEYDGGIEHSCDVYQVCLINRLVSDEPYISDFVRLCLESEDSNQVKMIRILSRNSFKEQMFSGVLQQYIKQGHDKHRDMIEAYLHYNGTLDCMDAA